jgi:hypothetical protein
MLMSMTWSPSLGCDLDHVLLWQERSKSSRMTLFTWPDLDAPALVLESPASGYGSPGAHTLRTVIEMQTA